ncbi:MAG: hypothetical protein NXI27_22410 [Alphaproteobacteria bacterium]|nr:hypothetical protein [Alphaproteobacteria bacterium]
MFSHSRTRGRFDDVAWMGSAGDHRTLVAFDNSEPHAPSYQGVLTLERKLPFPQITLPLLFGLIYSLSKILAAWPHPWTHSVAGIDDLARLAQARDFASGQGWFDLLQTRLNPPEGIWMHWSRFVDAPIAALLWLGELLGVGDALALMVWPVFLLVLFFVVVALACRALFGDTGIFFSVFVTLFFESTLRTFAPGRIDHHNVQIVLSALLLLSLLRLTDGRRWGIAAGLVAAMMMAIGIETLPLVGAGAIIVTGLWWWDARQFASGARAFGWSFAASTAAVFALSVPVSRYALTQCDSISLTHLVSAVLGGIGIALASGIVGPNSSRMSRAGAIGMLALICGGVAMTFFPHCLGDPYAFLDPKLREVWLDNVSEARSALIVLNTDPSVFFAAFIPLIVLVLTLGLALATVPAHSRWKWLVLAALALTGICVSFIQVRFVQIAHLFCIPAAAWLMSITFSALRTRGLHAARIALLVAIPVVASPWVVVLPKIVMAGTADPVTVSEATNQAAPVSNIVAECQGPTDRAAMAALPPGVVAAPIFFGSTVLGLSDLSVLSAPYHRAQQAILDTHAIFSGPPDRALPILVRQNIDYVMVCVSSTVRLVTGAQYPGSLIKAIEDDAPPIWLEPITAVPTPNLRIYRVRPEHG